MTKKMLFGYLEKKTQSQNIAKMGDFIDFYEWYQLWILQNVRFGHLGENLQNSEDKRYKRAQKRQEYRLQSLEMMQIDQFWSTFWAGKERAARLKLRQCGEGTRVMWDMEETVEL